MGYGINLNAGSFRNLCGPDLHAASRRPRRAAYLTSPVTLKDLVPSTTRAARNQAWSNCSAIAKRMLAVATRIPRDCATISRRAAEEGSRTTSYDSLKHPVTGARTEIRQPNECSPTRCG